MGGTLPEANTAPSFLSRGTGGIFGRDPWAIPRLTPQRSQDRRRTRCGDSGCERHPERKCDVAEVLDKGNFWAGCVQKFPVECFTSRLGKD